MKLKRNKSIIFLLLTILLWIGIFLVFRGNDRGVGVDEVKKYEKIEEVGQEDADTKQEKLILLNVPFTSQAPLGNWNDERYQDGCEEAASLMVIKWMLGESVTPSEANELIANISKYELEKFGYFNDTSAKDTVERILKGYFGYKSVEVQYDISAEDIKKEVYRGNLVIVPTNGKKLKNPYYTPPGPERHMFPIIGYDLVTDEFITNDNGTKRGMGYRYKSNLLEEAIQDYPSGNGIPSEDSRKAMIIIRPI